MPYSPPFSVINSCVFLKEVGSLEALSIEGHSNVGSLRKLSLTSCSSSRFHRFYCPTLVGIFPDLEELKVFPSMMGTSMVRGEKNTSDFMFPNLKKASLFISSRQSKEDVAVLGFVLRNSPSLNTLIVNLLFCFEDFDDLEFKNQLLGLKRASKEVEIKVLNEDDDEDEEEYYEEPEDDEVEEEYYEEREDASPFRNQNDMQDSDWSRSEDGFWDRDDDYTSPRLLPHLMAHIEDC
ncbi:uncharacterized protein LOC131061194 isoform X2 [Cryptomeria japonica]|uniref:uncharacterized protein LOC131061194 isoform X2 n=1 Tax=Cryptomeria japonica TaxID=3369 RepID=UPI0025ABB6CE|nr:uncharacterized protein LOC131061194 isoform X2 [Cryptomeria japonica]